MKNHSDCEKCRLYYIFNAVLETLELIKTSAKAPNLGDCVFSDLKTSAYK